MCRLHSTCPLPSGWDCGAVGTGLCAAAAAPRKKPHVPLINPRKTRSVGIFVQNGGVPLARGLVRPPAAWVDHACSPHAFGRLPGVYPRRLRRRW